MKIIFRVLLSVVSFLLAMEVSARIDDMVQYDAPLLSHYSSSVLISEDNEGIRYNVPYARFEKWKINNLGFRGPDTSVSKPKGIIRVLCMGASESFGLYENENKEWPAQVRVMLQENQNIQIINSSVAGLGLDHYRAYIDKNVLKLEPNVLILYINPFAYAAGIDKTRHQKKKVKNENMNIREMVDVFFTNIILNIRIIPKIKQTIKKMLPDEYYTKYAIWKMNKEIAILEKKYLDGEPSDEVDPKNLEMFRTDLEELLKYVRQNKITVILSSYPSLMTRQNIEEYMAVFLDARRFCVKLSFNGMIDASEKFNKEIENIAKKYEVIYVDNAAVVPKTLEYFGDNVHYTNIGANLIASNIKNVIISIKCSGMP